jgi:hypothetical protein
VTGRTLLGAAAIFAGGVVVGLVIGIGVRPEPPAGSVERAVVTSETRPADPAPARPRPVLDTVAEPQRPERPETEAPPGEDLPLSRAQEIESLREQMRDLERTLQEQMRSIRENEMSFRLLSALRWEAKLVLDDGQEDDVRRLAERFSAASSHPGDLPAERIARRRRAEAELARGLDTILRSDQRQRLAEHLDGEVLTETLTGGTDGRTLSSTGASREEAFALALRHYAKQLELDEETMTRIRDPFFTYLDSVVALNAKLEARHGRGFVEAIGSGPTAHTEAAEKARKQPGFPLAALEARAEQWRLQGELERTIDPLLPPEARERLREQEPTGLRIVLSAE